MQEFNQDPLLCYGSGTPETWQSLYAVTGMCWAACRQCLTNASY